MDSDRELRTVLYITNLVREKISHKQLKKFEDTCKVVYTLNSRPDIWLSMKDEPLDENHNLRSSNRMVFEFIPE
jgi:hypothetical protein